MSGFSDFWENTVLDHAIGRSSTALSTGLNATLWVGLKNTTWNDAWLITDTGEVGSTAAADNYSRVGVTNSSANWSNAAAGVKTNKTVIQFSASASTGWGVVKSVFVADSSSTASGNILFGGNLTGNTTVTTGMVVRFTTGSFTITLD